MQRYGTHSPKNARSDRRTAGAAPCGVSSPREHPRRKCVPRKHPCKDMAPTPQRIRAKRELPRCKRPQVPHLRCFCRLRRKCSSRKHSCKDMAPTPQRMREARAAAPQVLPRECAPLGAKCCTAGAPKETRIQRYGTHFRKNARSESCRTAGAPNRIHAARREVLHRRCRTFGVSAAFGAPCGVSSPSAEMLFKEAPMQRYGKHFPENPPR